MAQKESQHRESIEALNEELRQLRRQHDELTVLSNNQVRTGLTYGVTRVAILTASYLDH